MNGQSENKTFHTVCGLSDGFQCGLSVRVAGGVISEVRPADFPDPADRGICSKALATPQMVYHQDRLRFPLKRAGDRGEGNWQRISWNEALDSIVAKLQEISERYGSTSVAWVAPNLPSLAGGGYSRLASLIKATWVDPWAFDTAIGCANVAAFGWVRGQLHLSLENPRFGIAWAFNPAVTDHYRMRGIMEDKKGGCRLVAIDPRFTATASRADEHIPIRPGTDGALALAMIHVILEQGLQDERFIAENTDGPLLVRGDSGLFLRESDIIQGGNERRFMVFDENTLSPQPCDSPGIKPALTGRYLISGIQCRPAYQLLVDMVSQYAPERASDVTDIPVDVIRRLAISYATQKPASIYPGLGVRTFHGDLAYRAMNTLAAVTGNINLKRRSAFVLNWRSFLTPGEYYTRIPILMLSDAIAKGEPFSAKAVWFAGHNFVNQMPNMNRIVNEVFPSLELIAVSDLFMTATAKYADYVLPAASFYECMDLRMTPALRNTYLQLQQKVIEPLYECKSDFEIAADIGRKMGFGDYFSKTEEEYIEEILASGHPTMEGVSLERLKEGPVPPIPIERPQEFRTLTGRIQFYEERLKQFGQELPIYLEPLESARSEKAKSYPLTLLSTHTRHLANSSMADVPGLMTPGIEPLLEMNPVDAGQRDIGDGDVALVFNDRGHVKLRARLSENIKPGVVDVTQGWWPEQYMEGHHNQLTDDKVNPVQQILYVPNAAYFDVLVEVRKAQDED
ncbi:molybdopterin-dependent oxidoreductase [Chloroflexota bacterium]